MLHYLNLTWSAPLWREVFSKHDSRLSWQQRSSSLDRESERPGEVRWHSGFFHTDRRRKAAGTGCLFYIYMFYITVDFGYKDIR